jgi:hypothetical protein
MDGKTYNSETYSMKGDVSAAHFNTKQSKSSHHIDRGKDTLYANTAI